MVKLRQFFELTPGRITVGYGVFGVLWIGLSDRLVFSFLKSESGIIFAQRIKGWGFVVLSAALLFGLTRTYEGQLADSERRALTATEQLQVLHRIFRHNIRNELTVIHGYAELLLDRTERDRTEQWAHGILESSGDLLETSEKLGIINEVEFGAELEEPVDLVPILQREISALESTYPAATIETDFPDQLFVSANPAITYAIRETLENAMDHHPAPESERRIEITTAETMREVTLDIADNGPGIHSDEIDPVVSGAETALDHGSGIGLWIVSWICESSGGTVEFDAADGTSVRMRLERAELIEHVTDRLQYEFPTTPVE